MAKGYLGLTIELHHPSPRPGLAPGRDWGLAAATTYWPILRAFVNLADQGAAEVATVAVSASWLALASDPVARSSARAELDRLATKTGDSLGDQADELRDYWDSLRQFVVDRHGDDPLDALRRAGESGAIEIVPTTSSYTWIPTFATDRLTAKALVAPAVAEHERILGLPADGLWLPHHAYLPDFDRLIAESNCRYFGVDSHAFRRGTVRPPVDLLGPLITSCGVAAFGIDPEPTRALVHPQAGYAQDLRYLNITSGSIAVGEHADRFVDSWIAHAERSAAGRSFDQPPFSLVAIAARDLGENWTLGGDFLEAVLKRFSRFNPDGWISTTPGRYLDRFPRGPLGRPGPSAGGGLAIHPGGGDIADRCHEAALILEIAIANLAVDDRRARMIVAEMTRSLLAATALDWNTAPHAKIEPREGLERSQEHLDRFAELAAKLASGRLDQASTVPVDPHADYLASLDPATLLDPLDRAFAKGRFIN
jgi:1,4-alpha-glucan branching enzyme